MAELESTAGTLLQKDIDGNCSFCLQHLNTRPEVRRMPCDHNSCTGCLKEILARGNRIKCSESECKKIHEDIELDDIPVIYIRQVYECSGKRGGKQCEEDPESFCTKCQKIICSIHREWHDEFLGDHIEFVILIGQYKIESDKLTARRCNDHRTEEITTACNKCKKAMCTSCLGKDKLCPDQSVHEIVAVKEVADSVREELKSNVQKLLEFDEKLDTNFKLNNERMEELSQRQQKVKKQLREIVEKAINEMREAFRQTEEKIDEKTEAVMRKLRKFEKDSTPVQRSVQDMLVECSDLASGNDIDVIRRQGAIKERVNENYRETHVPTVPSIPIYTISNLSDTTVYPWKFKVAESIYSSISHKTDLKTDDACYTVAHLADGALVHGGNYGLAGSSGNWHKKRTAGIIPDCIYRDELSGNLFIMRQTNKQRLVYEIDPLSMKSTCIIKYSANDSTNLQHIAVNIHYIITTDTATKGLKVFDRLSKTHLFDIKLDLTTPLGVEFLSDFSVVVSDFNGQLQAITIDETPQIQWETKPLEGPSGIHVDHNRNLILVCCNHGTQLYIISLAGEHLSTLEVPDGKTGMHDLSVYGDELVVANREAGIRKFQLLSDEN